MVQGLSTENRASRLCSLEDTPALFVRLVAQSKLIRRSSHLYTARDFMATQKVRDG